MSQQGDRFEVIFNDHFNAVLNFALARVQPDVAKDVTADTFLAAWRALDQLPAEPRGWLVAVARRRLVDHYRSSSRRQRLSEILECFDEAVTPDPGEAHAELDGIRRAFSRLLPTDRELLRLIAWDDLTTQEAAEALECSRAVFSVRLHRARQRLRREIAVEDRCQGPSTAPPAVASLTSRKES